MRDVDLRLQLLLQRYLEPVAHILLLAAKHCELVVTLEVLSEAAHRFGGSKRDQSCTSVDHSMYDKHTDRTTLTLSAHVRKRMTYRQTSHEDSSSTVLVRYTTPQQRSEELSDEEDRNKVT